MSCRETGAGSAFTSYARFITGRQMSDRAVLSTIHQLRNVHLARPEEARILHTEEQYRALLQRQRERITTNTTLTEAQRASLLARMDRADSEPTPDQATLYALFNLTPTVRERTNAQRQFITNMAERTGETYNTVETRFNELSTRVTGHVSVSDQNAGHAAELGLSRDAGTISAIQQMESEARHMEAARAAQAPQRIERNTIPASSETFTGILNMAPGTDTEIPVGLLSLTSWGYDPRNGRLEVELADTITGETTTHAYQNIDSSLIDSMHANAGATWAQRVRGNTDYQYADEDTAALDGAAPQCPTCGQFANNTHTCPIVRQTTTFRPYTSGQRWTRQSIPTYGINQNDTPVVNSATITLPAIRRLQQAVAAGPVEIAMDQYIAAPVLDGDFSYRAQRARNSYIRGSVTVDTAEDGTLTIDTTSLRCQCQEYRDSGHCIHLDIASQGVRDRIERPNAATIAARNTAGLENVTVLAATRVQRAMDEAIATDWTRNEEALQEAARTWQTDSDVLYSQDTAAFITDIQTALDGARAKNGEPDIPYMTENALDGYCQRGSDKAFGVEIEYEFPSSMPYSDRNDANRRIGQQLYAAGLTYSPDQQGYRASQYRGFRDAHTDANGVGNWSWEHDGSVDGELVTPGMYDEPETWQKLQTAVRILRDNGATAGLKAGAHVHVGTNDYNGSPAAYTELARLATEHEDDLVRLASSPSRRTHRNNGYSAPLPVVPPTGFRSVGEAHNWQDNSAGRYATINLANCRGGTGDHPELRVFDSTLDAGAIQAQVKIAVAMTVAANRIAATAGPADRTEVRGKEPWGAHVRRNPTYNATTQQSAEEIAEDTGTLRSFIDTLFRRREDKAQIAAIVANTRWSGAANSH